MSIGARLSLIKSTMSHLPLYYMSLFKAPITVINKLERMQRQFLWGDGLIKRKIHLVGWDKVSKSKKFGGLGIKKLLHQNQALLSKWWWRFGTEKNSLWTQVIEEIQKLKIESVNQEHICAENQRLLFNSLCFCVAYNRSTLCLLYTAFHYLLNTFN